METTYGDRCHKSVASSVEELYGAIRDTFAGGGNVLIPTFAVGRAQELLYFLRDGMETGRLPDYMQMFLDSPMAISATEIFHRHPECYDAQAAALFQTRADPFAVPNLHYTRETADSIAINRFRNGAVVKKIAGAKPGTVLVDTQAAFDRLLTTYYPATINWDRVHPNPTGSALIARAFLTAIGFGRPGDPVFNAVHDLAIGRDGSIYVAETRTKRVVKLRPAR